ncbi:hypothetical protein MAPG_03705 [Magnaporthiopsis poae ATCC 64411]|uniref:Threonylcarbamoyl-AMP synthase C-terminal domain-containing protein n=1 Tax=Magnaporthiopsis poae (strain ATCC 64411 / 73-15) TaxID=644358 RepID=A0A0C4DUR3_MAGP6|nr:hypothetical protein MAPG_03705 [Magnaporthiopsis poae ATCC 64411]
MKTEVVKVDAAAAASLGRFREVVAAEEETRLSNGNGNGVTVSSSNSKRSTRKITPIQNLASWELTTPSSSAGSGGDENPALEPLRRAAERLGSSDVRFPTRKPSTASGAGRDAAAHHSISVLISPRLKRIKTSPYGPSRSLVMYLGVGGPPAVLRPGGVGIEEIRACKGWEGVQRAYRDEAAAPHSAAPRAPGMKYKHYSPRAVVVLYEDGFGADEGVWPSSSAGRGRRIGVIRTRSSPSEDGTATTANGEMGGRKPRFLEHETRDADGSVTMTVLETSLGRDPRHVAQGLFSALREMDARSAEVIFVEGVGDGDDIAAAVMNRLRKAASEVR